jgi:hypothetical protein
VSAADDAAMIADTYYDDPAGYVRDVIGPEPDEWQAETMADIARESRIAVASGHGIGKTALISWIIKWFLATRPDPQVVVTANTSNQLSSKTWRELAKWNALSLDGKLYTHTATRFALRGAESTWFASAIPWSEHNSEAFAGTHDKNVLMLFDEASNIAQVIWDVAEGAMTTDGAKWVAFGNPTRNTGAFRECFGKFRHRWITRQIDSRSAKMCNLEQIQRWIADYGEDSDFVRVRVKGEFPRAGSNQFISGEDVDSCVEYVAEGFEDFPRVMAVDVARFGDDSSVICIKQGRLVYPLIKFKGLDTMQLAGKVVEEIPKWKPAAVVIDGVGIGAGVVDRVTQLNYGHLVTELNGGSAPTDQITYFNRRAELWGLMRDALHAGMEIPDDRQLRDDLIGPEYGFTAKNQIQLEKKEDMKKRGLASPDCGDALAMTFAVSPCVQEPMAKNWRAQLARRNAASSQAA